MLGVFVYGEPGKKNVNQMTRCINMDEMRGCDAHREGV